MADRGVHAVSLREIVAAAEQRNASCIQYHFGDRRGLVGAVVARHMARIDADRNARLDALAGAGRTGAHDVIAALVLPLAGALGTPSGRCYLRIVDDLVERPGDVAAAPPGMHRSLDRVGRLLAGVLADVSPAVRAARLELCTTFLLRALAMRARRIDAGERMRLGDAQWTANLVDVLAAGLVAPAAR